MAYEYLLKTDEAARLAAISRRTLDRFLAEKHGLNDAEVLLLGQLDPKEVLGFAGRYFLLLEDAPLQNGPEDAAGYGDVARQHSRNATICAHLASEGTQAVMPGLLAALKQNRFLPPTSATPYRMPWLALLAIAARDPWPGMDDDLAALLDKSELLVDERPEGPELSATAAGLLLKRHPRPAGRMGLEAVSDPMLANLKIAGYRWASRAAAKEMRAWWDATRKAKAEMPR